MGDYDFMDGEFCCGVDAANKEKIDDLERALVTLARASKNWNLNVSQDDEFLIDRLVAEIESK